MKKVEFAKSDNVSFPFDWITVKYILIWLACILCWLCALTVFSLMEDGTYAKIKSHVEKMEHDRKVIHWKNN